MLRKFSFNMLRLRGHIEWSAIAGGPVTLQIYYLCDAKRCKVVFIDLQLCQLWKPIIDKVEVLK